MTGRNPFRQNYQAKARRRMRELERFKLRCAEENAERQARGEAPIDFTRKITEYARQLRCAARL